ncbi:MAG: hypothetical protein GX654_02805 [Desulfatiglans sp.]|nr:hypothetical protein [Desulfatiglans sp.]
MGNDTKKSGVPLSQTLSSPIVGQSIENRENSGTASKTICGTPSLKALADKVLHKENVGHPVGQAVGQINDNCPKPVGQQEITDINNIHNKYNNINNLYNIYSDKTKCPTFQGYSDGTAGQHDFDMDIDRTIFEFNTKLSSNYEMKEMPKGFAHKALKMEAAYTLACSNGDVNRFRELLNQWRGFWLSLMIKKSVTFH